MNCIEDVICKMATIFPQPPCVNAHLRFEDSNPSVGSIVSPWPLWGRLCLSDLNVSGQVMIVLCVPNLRLGSCYVWVRQLVKDNCVLEMGSSVVTNTKNWQDQLNF